ncbi:MAG TPA: amino acid dehydrogenase [Gammaproteobacteria bacterium]|nr:amino acid dehydrogenase [Gammaproteobacteria bacterium]
MTESTKPLNVHAVKSSRSSHSAYDSLMRYARFLGYGDVHVKFDEKTGLHAIVAIHNLNRGPAIGGCRFISYNSMDKAMEDALRLGYMMSYKAAIVNLPHGGAKSVIIKPRVIKNREALLEKFGEFVEELGGRYITAVDSGTSPADMDIIAKRSRFVTCTTKSGGGSDPSPLTALGVRRGIEAAVKFQMDRETLDGIHVAIQGAGHVGYYLAKELTARGARITITDINTNALQKCIDEFGVDVCRPDEIYDVNANVFAPCALGATVNMDSIKRMKATIVAGSANNQLAHSKYAAVMKEKGILYAPDFLINSGGLIHVAVTYAEGTIQESLKKINDLYQMTYDVFERAASEDLDTHKVAVKIAQERLNIAR